MKINLMSGMRYPDWRKVRLFDGKGGARDKQIEEMHGGGVRVALGANGLMVPAGGKERETPKSKGNYEENALTLRTLSLIPSSRP